LDPINYDNLIAFVLVGFALTGSPGPASLSLAATGAAYGFRAGRNYLIGLTFGVMIVASCVAAGVFAAIIAIPYAAEILTVFATLYIGYLAFKIATAPPASVPSATADAPGFIAGMILNLSNPKAYAAFATLFSGFQLIPQSPTQSVLVQLLVSFIILCIVNPMWMYLGSALRHILRDDKTSRHVNQAFAVLLVASVLMTVFL
jgi:threonine/homoserine/homoserine lactone efflux protein